MVVTDSDGVLDVDDLNEDLQAISTNAPAERSGGADHLVGKSLEEIERHYIMQTLKVTNGNREEAARSWASASERSIASSRNTARGETATLFGYSRKPQTANKPSAESLRTRVLSFCTQDQQVE